MAELRPAVEEVGERREAGGGKPGQGDDEEALAHADPAAALGGRPLERVPDAARDHPGDDERPERAPRTRARTGWGRARRARGTSRACRRGSRRQGRRSRADAEARSAAGGLGQAQSASTTRGASAASVKTITRSPDSSMSSPCGKIAFPFRTIAPINAPWIGMSRNSIPT